MPTSTLVNIYEIEVGLDTSQNPPKVTIGGPDVLANGKIAIPQGIHLLRFVLSDLAPGAAFPSSPIEWITSAMQPPQLPLQWHSPKQVGMVIFNAMGLQSQSPGGAGFGFFVTVVLGDQLLSSKDPTIICDPPGSPPP